MHFSLDLCFLHLYAFESLPFLSPKNIWRTLNRIFWIQFNIFPVTVGVLWGKIHWKCGAWISAHHKVFVTVCAETSLEIGGKLLETFIVIGHRMAPRHLDLCFSDTSFFNLILQNYQSVVERGEDLSPQLDWEALLYFPPSIWAQCRERSALTPTCSAGLIKFLCLLPCSILIFLSLFAAFKEHFCRSLFSSPALFFFPPSSLFLVILPPLVSW